MFKPSQFEKWTFASTATSVFLIESLVCLKDYVDGCSNELLEIVQLSFRLLLLSYNKDLITPNFDQCCTEFI